MTFRFNPFTNKLDLVDGRGIAAVDSFKVDTDTPPGTNPVVPDGSGVVTVTGAQVASGTVGANVIQTASLAANTYTIEVQRAGSAAAADSTLNGVSHYNSAQFSVDSNAFVSLAGSVSTSYVEDDGSTATPALGVLHVLTNETSANNANGIQSRGATNVVTISLTNRLRGTTTTTDGSTVLCVSFSLGVTPATYIFNGSIIAFNITTPGSYTTNFSFAARTDGTTATTIGAEFTNVFEESSMSSANSAIGHAADSVEVFVIGIAGQTIDWVVIAEYTVVT